jgi:hypothetical protein
MEILVLTNQHNHLWWQPINQLLKENEKILLKTFIPVCGPLPEFTFDQAWFDRAVEYIQGELFR